MEFIGSSPPANPVSGKVSAGVAAPVMDLWSTITPEKPVDVREAAQKLRKRDPTRREISDPVLSSDDPVSGKVSALIIDQLSIITPEKPIRNRIPRSLLSLKDIREAAQKLRKPDLTRREIYDPLLSSVEVISPSVSESPASERKKDVNSVKLPGKYKMLKKFFKSMDSSIRMLHLKGSATTFTNIKVKVEILTDRRFTYNHLAQLKFILPEAIEIKKILKYDERSCCMKPDLYITLNANAVDNSEKWNSYRSSVLLRKVFRSRLLDFFKSHPEGYDIPEERLPGSFTTPSKQARTISSRLSGSSLTSEAPNGMFPVQSIAASHLSESFRRSFSNRASINGGTDVKDEYRVELVPISLVPIPLQVESSTKKKTVSRADIPKSSLKQTSCMKYSLGEIVSASSPSCQPPAPPIIEAKKGEDGSTSAPETPMLKPPKRCYMSPDDDTAASPIKLARRPSTRRSLFFDTPVKSAKAADQASESGMISSDDDILDFLPENLLQSIREKETQAKRRKQMIAYLPSLFDIIYFLFQSIKRSFITKEEIIHRVISSHLEITDKSQVEPLLILLQELAPEWIYEKTASSGTLLLVNKISNPNTIRSRLAEAK